MKIVYVDDLGVENTKQMLEMDGHAVYDFLSADEAYDFIVENQWTIDLVLIDEKLNHTTSKKYQSGLALGKAITNFSKILPMVMITGGDFKIETSVRAFTQSGFSHFIKKPLFEKKPEGYLVEICDLDAVKTKWALRSQYKENLILDYFNSILDDERNNLIEKCQLDEYDWRSHVINVVDGGALYLSTFFEEVTSSDSTIRNKVSDYLDMTNIEFEMNGWNQQNWINVYWKKYVRGKDYKKMVDIINFEAFNILTEIRYLVKNISPSHQVNLCKIKVQNVKQYIGNGYSNNAILFEVFIQKMICRRVLIGFSECIFDYNGSDYSYAEVCKLLRYGHLLTTTKDIVKDYIPTKLGLSREGDKIVVLPHTTFREERDWLNTYKEAGLEIREILDSFETESLCDLNDWKQFSARRKREGQPIDLPKASDIAKKILLL